MAPPIHYADTRTAGGTPVAVCRPMGQVTEQEFWSANGERVTCPVCLSVMRDRQGQVTISEGDWFVRRG